jgi:hypothetical protein
MKKLISILALGLTVGLAIGVFAQQTNLFNLHQSVSLKASEVFTITKKSGTKTSTIYSYTVPTGKSVNMVLNIRGIIK